MVSLVHELMRTQRELRHVKEQLRSVSNRLLFSLPSYSAFSYKSMNPISHLKIQLFLYLFSIMAFSMNYVTFVKQ